MSIRNHPSPESLVLFTDGELTPLEVREVAAHIDDCPDCALEIAVATQLRDLQAENLIAYPGPSRREAGITRLRTLAPRGSAFGPTLVPKTPTGFAAFDVTTLLGGAIGVDGLAHLLGPAAQPSLPISGGLMGHEPGSPPELGREETGTQLGEPPLADHGPGSEKNLDHDVRNEGGTSSRSAEREIPKHDGLDSLIDEARRLFAEGSNSPGHGQDDDTDQAGTWFTFDDRSLNLLGSTNEGEHVIDSPGLSEPLDFQESGSVGPEQGSGHHEAPDHLEDSGHDNSPDNHDLPGTGHDDAF